MDKYERLFDSKPDNNRIRKELDTYEVLQKLEIPFLGIDHEEAMTMEDLQAVEKALDVKVSKNLLLCNAQKTKFYMLIMPADKKFLTKNLSKQVNSSRLSFADSVYMERFLNITPGSLSIFGLMYDMDNNVQLVIDKTVLEDEYFACHPCINTSTLKIKTSDIMNIFLPLTNHEPIIVEL
ncbi:prolyl-tRNA synthetase associated domain-containing protein [Sedimentibacter sp. MB31-C6]|uniref:prolyl-tRNA synthetase associated domain-containing protein n=1 Tax=Sedimentibacter sp. MB31-C6 TaxID=3109366 RepID=UPI002DDD9B99|nr:prolyl-tRNA synthetase associated domain-containing protein [Sedimentibacter sp. MB36-C1]WSI03668.1 prolyl-tRNA synthetase associated domain-containing protein [Sedimentibacter sp. MB36-C1]